MRVEEMALRSEIRQMLNEAGFTRETLKQMVKDTIEDVVENQVNQVLMEKRDEDLSETVSNYLNGQMHSLIRRSAEEVIRDKFRWLKFNINVNVIDENKIEN